jgi:hypothetical protein
MCLYPAHAVARSPYWPLHGEGEGEGERGDRPPQHTHLSPVPCVPSTVFAAPCCDQLCKVKQHSDSQVVLKRGIR